MKLYSYWRSTTSFRVRIALNLKGLSYDYCPVDLVAGEQGSVSYTALNPGKGVPTLVLEDGTALTQSLAIIDYLEAIAPEPQLLPAQPLLRARVQAAAYTIAMDIHPVNNLRVMTYLKSQIGMDSAGQTAWFDRWMTEGFAAYRALLPQNTYFSFADTPTLADICLVPQLYYAHRWGGGHDTLSAIARDRKHALSLTAFDQARLETQPSAS